VERAATRELGLAARQFENLWNLNERNSKFSPTLHIHIDPYDTIGATAITNGARKVDIWIRS
jgi:hypothetical protein